MADLRLLRARNRLADGFKDDASELASHLVTGAVTVLDWAKAFASLISHGITAGFMLGRGTDTLDQRSSGIVSGLIQTQYGYAGPFAQAVSDAIDTGAPMSEGAIASRSGLYAGGSVIHPFEVGQSDAFGIQLPYYPTDDSPCQGNCRCHWDITDDGNIIQAVWIAQDDGKVCDVCQARADAEPIVSTSMAA